MFKNVNRLLFWCCLFIGLSLVLAAFGGHQLKNILSIHKLETFKAGCNYLAIHSIGILIIILFNNTTKMAIPPKAIYTLFCGLLIFCISFLVVSFSEINGLAFAKYFGATAPIGAAILILGWIWVAFSFKKQWTKNA